MRRSIVRYAASGLLIASVLVCAVAYLGSRDDDSEVQAQVPPASGVTSGVSATAFQLVPMGSATALSLNVGFEQPGPNGDVQSAVAAVQAKITAVWAAMKGLGIPADKIAPATMNIYSGGPYPVSDAEGGVSMTPVPFNPKGGGPGFSIFANVTVELASTMQISAAMDAAFSAGATSVNAASGAGGSMSTAPDAAALAPGIEAATKQAQLMAQTSAKAAGAKLGAVHSVSVAAPSPNYANGGPYAPDWIVAVTVTYNLAP